MSDSKPIEATPSAHGEKRRRPRLTPTKNDPQKPGADDGLRMFATRLPPALIREIASHAKRAGVSRSDALRDCLAVGLETIRGREGVPAGRVDELLGALDAVRVSLDLVGPPTFGMLRLLAHWAAKDGAVKVNEDELLAEVRSAGADEWEQAVAEAERELHNASKTGADGEGS